MSQSSWRRLESVTPQAVHLAQTGRQLFDRGSVDELRLALVVLDGLAEMLLRFNTSVQDVPLDLGEAVVSMNAEYVDAGLDAPMEVHHLRFPITLVKADIDGDPVVHLAKNQRRKLYEFDPNVDVAVFLAR
jgi:hypothetical protein